MNWINVKDGMPPEKDSIFAKCYGTDKWKPAMFRKRSDNVLITIELPDGTRKTMEAHTTDGVWRLNFNFLKAKVLFWAPMPEPCRDDMPICKATGIRCSNCRPVCEHRSEE